MNADIGLISHALGALAFLVLAAGQLRHWNSERSSRTLLAATLATLAWCVALSLQEWLTSTNFYLILTLEILRNSAWYAFLLSMLGIGKVFGHERSTDDGPGLQVMAAVALGFPLVLLSVLWIDVHVKEVTVLYMAFGGSLFLSGFLVMAIIGLGLLEQVIRNARQDHLWHIKFLCVGLGVLFSFDLYLYSDAILFGRVNATFWDFRGVVALLSAPLVGIGVFRTSSQPIQINISRRLVFHTGMLLVAGLYLLSMAAAGYYIRNFSGEWGLILQMLFWLISLSLLLVLTFSGRFRSYLRFYISRNLFSTKYDYREEWLRISHTLSQASSELSLPERAIKALADIVDSQGGGLWLSRDGRHYDQVAQIELGWIEDGGLTREAPLIAFLAERNWIIEVNGAGRLDQQIELPAWMQNLRKLWLVIPLRLDEKLLGFILLKDARIETSLTWEDLDLLKAAAQQTASYLAQLIATEELSHARQFSAFNQMSAFVVHDIKTLNSQLSLLVSNAARHKGNPEFIEDMIKTTQHAVKKMNFLLEHFRHSAGGESKDAERVDLVALVRQVVESKKHLSPVPDFRPALDELFILANKHELASAIGHVVQNAQEATPKSGNVLISLCTQGAVAVLEVEDTGSGMSQEFINTSLFRPFESTKGLTGMGVGVYQSRETVRALGGDLKVMSEPGAGSTFTFTIPLR